MSEQWTYRTNRAFGAMGEGEMVTFEDGDPAMGSLLGTGYLDLVASPSLPGIPSQEKLHEPVVTQSAPEKDVEDKS